MKTMLEVLADHQQLVSGSCGLEDECNCGFELRNASIQAHQADMLHAAGVGSINDARDRVGRQYANLHQMLRDELQAQAWDEGYVAGDSDRWLKVMTPTTNPHRSRA